MIAWLLALAMAATWPGDPTSEAFDWTTIDTGVELVDVEPGSGQEAELGARVVVHYTGMLGDGTVFDSSVERGTPFEFRIGQHQVIRGWEDGLIGASPGTVRLLAIPPSQGYGDRPTGAIPPGSTLYFRVEVLEVHPPRKPPERPQSVDPSQFKNKGGLGLAVIEKGTGRKPTAGERVRVDWSAWANGRLVEHTFATEDGRWFRYEEGKVAQAIFEGIAKQREGALIQLRVPPELAVPPHRPEDVDPGEGLLYEVRLIEAKPKVR